MQNIYIWWNTLTIPHGLHFFSVPISSVFNFITESEYLLTPTMSNQIMA